MEEITIAGIDEVINYFVCDNGLKVYIWVNEKVSSTMMSLYVKYGSVDTEFTVNNAHFSVPNGTAHFLEHVKFNEGKNFTAHDFYSKTGADVNAFTTFDYTSYYVHAIDNIEENLTHLLDFVQIPYFTSSLIQKEKGIIKEEEKMGEDNPSTVHYFGIFKNLFCESRYRNIITGRINDIKSTTLKDIESAFVNFYHPKNMALFITGNVNPHELKMIINDNQNSKVFNDFQNPVVDVPKEKLKVNVDFQEVEGNVAIPKLKYGIKISKKKFKKYNDFDIRLMINLLLSINFGSTSDLKEYLIQNHLATYLHADCDIYDDYIIIIISTETKFPNDVLKLIVDKLENLEISKETFERKLKAIIATYILNYDDIEKVNMLMQDDFANYNEVLSDTKKRYENLKYNEIIELKELLTFDNHTTFILKPKKN